MIYNLQTTPIMPLADDKIAIVLPTPALLLQEFGDRIDSFKEILRFSKFKIAGFEKHVGTRTTIWATCDAYLKKKNILLGVKILNTTSEMGDERERNGRAPNVCFDMADHWKKELTDKCEGNPTSGMIAIQLCLNSGITPHLFGYEPEHSEHYAYYWAPNEHAGHWEKHNSKKEKEIINQYVEDGLIKIG